ncbi:MAG: acetyltransferase [Sphingobacteriia bacterium]|nr:acetyltransferase [Sphingobacteriia bacterium]NCC38236.1 acetyltransferase [Gammaproteobacteria bacterium]
MTNYDVFNGDADGLCALQQLRLAEPLEAQLVTGVKRDIALLERIEARAGDRLTVLDLSFDKNRDAVARLLEQGAWIRYFDHHHAGEIPVHPRLETHIETRADRGTSLLVDMALQGAHRAWAVVGTFGDNFDATARQAAAPLGLAAADLERLRALGIYLNYNGYGETLEDLWIAPDALFRQLSHYRDPLEFIATEPTFALLQAGYQDDMAQARAVTPVFADHGCRLYCLPAAAWARRASGVLANDLAQAAPGQAHAILTQRATGGFIVSVRAPLARPDGADRLCRAFPGGGGRRAAAGINHLSDDAFDTFLERFRTHDWC